MELESLAAGYAETAAGLEQQAAAKRRAIKRAVGSEYARLRRALTLLEQQVHESRTIAELCARYYEPDYHLPVEFTIQEDMRHGRPRRYDRADECGDADGFDSGTA